jgi:NarL family two-component system sensor histidine kinase LiaS
MRLMTINRPKNPLPDTLWPPLARLWSFPRRLQWRLTLAYALFTAITALAFGIIGVALWWYLTFWVWLPNDVANNLLRTVPSLSPHLEHTPSDQVGLNNWLDEVVIGNRPAIRSPAADKKDSPPPLPPHRLDRVVSVAIVDTAGQLLISYPAETFVMEEPLSVQIPPEAMAGFQAALQGETDPAELATRKAAGNIVATAPIFGSNQQLLGAIFVEVVPPLQESQFFQLALRQMILPVVWGVLIIGGMAGVLFGYFIGRNLTRRLYALARAADAWSNGDFDVLVSDNSGDELGQLTQRLNQMALQLQTLLQTRQELASLDERNRLARDLHDAVKQQVFATAMQVGAALTFFDQNPPAAKASLIETDRLVRQTQQELTSLIQELRPAALEDKGLTTALREYINDWSRQNNIAAELRVRGEQSLPFLVEQTLFRVTQEALANIARHSDATTVEVYLVWAGDQVTLTLTDNGRGFNPATLPGKGLGLRSMRERVEAIGGHLNVISQLEGGTQVMVRCDKLPP